MPLFLRRAVALRRSVADAGLKTLEYAIAAGLAIMLALVFTNAVLRYAFDSGIAEAEEISMMLLVWTTFLGAVVALARGEHLGIELLDRFGASTRLAAGILADALMLSVAGLLIRGSWVQVEVNRVNSLPVTEISMAWLYAAGVVAGGLIAVVLVAQLLGRVAEFWARNADRPDSQVLARGPAE